MKKLAPILLFTYNRPEHTRRTIESLQKNTLAEGSELFVFSDGSRLRQDPAGQINQEKVCEVREYLKTISGFKKIEIRESENNKGLAESIISGVTEIVNEYGKVIILEDDLVSSQYFLKFMNEALDLYEEETQVASVHGYIYPIKDVLPDTFFLKHASSWGWGTWKRAWDLFEADGKVLLRKLHDKNLITELNINGSYNFVGMLQRQIKGMTNSWAIRWDASCLVNDMLNLYPNRSLIQNIGQDGSGEHGGKSDKHDVDITKSPIKVCKLTPEKSIAASASLEKFFRSLRPSLLEKIIFRLRKLW